MKTIGANVPTGDPDIGVINARTLSAQSKGYTTLVLVAVGGNVVFSVTWTTAFPDTNYTPFLTQAPAGVGEPTFSAKTKTGVTVTCPATSPVAIGSVFRVAAVRFA